MVAAARLLVGVFAREALLLDTGHVDDVRLRSGDDHVRLDFKRDAGCRQSRENIVGPANFVSVTL